MFQTNCTYNADRVVGNGSFGVVFQVSLQFSFATKKERLFEQTRFVFIEALSANMHFLLLQATRAETGEVVAIKKVYQDKRYKNRELQIMKELQHPNVICL